MHALCSPLGCMGKVVSRALLSPYPLFLRSVILGVWFPPFIVPNYNGNGPARHGLGTLDLLLTNPDT